MRILKTFLKGFWICDNVYEIIVILHIAIIKSHYLSALTLSWCAMLNMTKVELELVSDAYMCLFFEKGMTGGVSYISKRYGKASNKYLKSSDAKQELKHIMYLDANNLHGYGISKFLPINGFKWIDPKEFDSNKLYSNNWKGCVLKVDPKELNELYNDYSLALDKTEIKRKMLSYYQLKIVIFMFLLALLKN